MRKVSAHSLECILHLISENLPCCFQVGRKDNFFEDKNVKGVLCGCFELVLPC